MTKCKHNFKTLQQHISIGNRDYADGLIQCQKCLKCFCYGFDRSKDRNRITPIEVEAENDGN